MGVLPTRKPLAPHSTLKEFMQCAAASYATVPPPEFLLQTQNAVVAPLVAQIYAHPSDGRDWGEAHRSEAFFRRSLLPPFSDPAFFQLSHQFRQHFFRIRCTGPRDFVGFDVGSLFFPECYASSRSISLSTVIAP